MLYMQLPKVGEYHASVNIDDSYQYKDSYDEWGAAELFDRNGNGVEYNLCYDGKSEMSAIYKVDGFDIDESSHISYEIDFSFDDWKERLINAMIKAHNKFWKE